MQTIRERKAKPTLRKWALLLLSCGLSIPCHASTSFVGYYDVSNWTLTNTNSDGTVVATGLGTGLYLTGGDNGTGDFGTTDFTILTPQAGMVSFSYLLWSDDGFDFDTQGWLLIRGVTTTFTPFRTVETDPELGSLSFAVLAGDRFGFRMYTADNTFGPAYASIGTFSAPDPLADPPSVPEPNYSWGLPLIICGIGYMARRRNGVDVKEQV